MTRISAVVFDMYGTLTPSWPKSVWDEQKRACAASLGIPETEWVAALDAAWHERLIGAYGSLAETFRMVAQQCGHSPTPAELTKSVETRYAAYRKVQELRGDALDTLRVLRASDLKIALVSDCTHELPDLWDSLGLGPYFDATVFSCSEGVRKPAAELFLAAATRLGVEPQQCLYVGDGGGDEMAGSAAVGMLPLLLVAPDWAEHHAPGRPEQQWTGLRATALSQIPQILAGLAAA